MNTPSPARRLTKQRQIILEKLRAVTSHPTADEVYDMVRKDLPKISLGTVYRNLEVLNADGHIQIIRAPGGQKRFDADTSPHHHVVCIHCGAVGDVFNVKDNPVDQTRMMSDFTILGQTTFFYGICPQCQPKSVPNAPRGIS
ncbi:Fur family transcriptional regulator [Desulfoplanes formicivorans]|uniref:Fur family transcriptional regulator n=1 Tax=Desulfoplanes formicivorans TaxID=1592317 RepID=A0A194AEL4_9BACT|nr:transcriptional repressor [Desulfoplanes formicivorans]GAU07768.1 Fur family transcriptional regulator [Desulfoplanes formicivorans]